PKPLTALNSQSFIAGTAAAAAEKLIVEDARSPPLFSHAEGALNAPQLAFDVGFYFSCLIRNKSDFENSIKTPFKPAPLLDSWLLKKSKKG
ncbi:hypothetical protein, partial [Erwinia sp. MYb416]|uniref:hypothetical protein n=1 Tax=Erwinia sp. MYb416 TaxID=3108532 RepID=UPI0030B6E20C